MPHAPAPGASLYYEEAGSGLPIVFVHEFAADLRTWEAQMRFFSRHYRCIAFNARGYPPSSVPLEDSLYGQEHAADDIAAVLDHLGLDKAHVVGLSQGGAAVLHFGLRHPHRAIGIVATSAGSGASRSADEHKAFVANALANADRLEAGGMPALMQDLTRMTSRLQLAVKNPRGFAEFVQYLSEHSAKGSALTMRNYQAKRASLYELKDAFAAMRVPTLLVVGDEDEPVLDVNLFLKRTLPAAGLWVLPQTGHSVNLEEPDLYHRVLHDFFIAVEQQRWLPQRQRFAGLA